MKFPSEVKLLGVINYIYKRTPIYVVPLIISGFLVKMLTVSTVTTPAALSQLILDDFRDADPILERILL